MKKRILSVLLALVCLMTMAATFAFAETAVVSIKTEADLAKIRQDLTGHYRLDADIKIAATNFKPIAAERMKEPGAESVPFSGTFDGNGHMIRGLTVTVDASDEDTMPIVGMFGEVSGVVKDLELRDVRVTFTTDPSSQDALMQEAYVGAIAGRINKTAVISGCTVTGSVTATVTGGESKLDVGGIVGGAWGTVENCINRASVTGKGNSKQWVLTGGIAGYVNRTVNSNGNLVSCVNFGKLSATTTAADKSNLFRAGLAAYNYGPIVNSYFADTESVGANNRSSKFTSENTVFSFAAANEDQQSTFPMLDFTNVFAIKNGKLALKAAHDHVWASTYTVDKPATTTATGIKSIHCTVCDEIKEGSAVVIEKLKTQVNFTDVPKKAWYANAVYYTVDQGIFAGITATTFEPDTPMTRAMFVATLSRMAGVKVNNKAASKFSDVKSGQWYTGAVKWASDNGIVKGSNGKFMPNDPITREQICTIFVTYAKYKKTTLSPKQPAMNFKDAKKISKWARSAVTTCQRAGLVAGSNGNFNPQGKASRAEVAQILATYDQTYGK